jgi:signal transduction histidine kinase
MLGRLEEAQARQQRLVSDASHELRNPVAAIRQHAETALAHPERTTVPALAGDILSEDLRLQQLAEDLLMLARADERALQLSLQPLDVDDLVVEEARRLRQTTALAVDTSETSAVRTSGDRLQLQRALRNLVDNASRHASKTVRLAVHEDDGQVVLQVDDDGPGIPETERESIFERFTRLDAARDRARGGAGLGLPIVAAIVTAHGGKVIVLEAPLGGARFEIRLPLRQS